MVEFREYDELEDDDENIRVQFGKRLLTKEERNQLLQEVYVEVFGALDTPETISEGSIRKHEEWEIRSREILHETLNTHWKIILTPNFNKRYKRAITYCSLLGALDNHTILPTPEEYRNFAKENDIHRTTATRWGEGMKKPPLINQLEELRKQFLDDSNNCDPEQLPIFSNDRTPNVIFSNDEPLKIVDWQPLVKSDFETRIGTVDDRKYVWVQDKNSLLSAYGNQYFYFNRMEDLDRIFQEASSRLELDSIVEAVHHIYQLSKQFTKIERRLITKDNPRIPGSSLHLLCDIAGISINQLEGRIEKIAGANGHGGIENPLFPTSDNLEELKARIIGIAVSDCHLPKSGTMSLFEGSLNRIQRVKKILDNFGVMYSSDSLIKREGDYAFYIASPLLSALEYWGIPTGDRTIQNYGLPADFQYWSKKAKCGYMQEMLAQEGHVDINSVIRWNRSHALHDGKKGSQYGFKSKITEDALEFLKHSREMHKHQGIVSEQSIAVGRIDFLKDNQDTKLFTVAKELVDVIWDYRNRLIDDETKIAKSLGINISLKPARLSYFEKSDRVSIKWQARVKGYKSKIRSSLIIKPNYETKESILLEWLANQNVEDVQQETLKLKSEGYKILG